MKAKVANGKVFLKEWGMGEVMFDAATKALKNLGYKSSFYWPISWGEDFIEVDLSDLETSAAVTAIKAAIQDVRERQRTLKEKESAILEVLKLLEVEVE